MFKALRTSNAVITGIIWTIWVSLTAGCARYGFELPEYYICLGVTCSGHGTCGATPDGEAVCSCDEGYHNDGPTQCVPDEAECHQDQECDDSDVCTDDVCNDYLCEHVFNTAPCDDGLFCTVDDACTGGSCLGSGTPCPGQVCDEDADLCRDCQTDGECDDGNACTDDSCVSGTCQHASNGDPCDDGLFCTAADSCAGGSCTGSGDACPGQMCDEAGDACVECLADGDCDDGDICTDDGCQSGACQNLNNTAPCDDGQFCTATDACSGGICQGSGDACPGQACDETADACVDCQVDGDCDDGELCTDDSCVAGACVHNENSLACDDTLFCTTNDACVGGVCQGSGDACPGQICDEIGDACVDCLVDGDCDDTDVCTDDACNAGSCEYANNTAPCDDGEFCTLTDACGAGLCTGSGDSCPGQLCNEINDVCVDCFVAGDCDDGEVCTIDSCNAGTCEYVNNAAASCDDGLFCTTTHSCIGGACEGSVDPCLPLACDEDNDTCVNCTGDPDCDDGDVCTGTETCVGGNCVPGTPLVCDDGQYCNGAESCDPLLGCQAGSDPCGTAMCNSCDEVDDNCYLELGAACAPDTPLAERGNNRMYCMDGACTHWCNNSFEEPGDSDHECPIDYTCWMHADTDGAGYCVTGAGSAVTGDPCNDHPDCRSLNCLENECSDTCSSSLDCTDTGPNTADYTCLVWEYWVKSGSKVWFDHGACEPTPGGGAIGDDCFSSLDCHEGCFTNPDNSRECRNLCCTEDECDPDRTCWPYLNGQTDSTVRTCEIKDPRGPNGFGTPCTGTDFYDPNCASGLCVDIGLGELCNRFCCRDLDCPPGYRCEFAFILPRQGNEENLIRACIPE